MTDATSIYLAASWRMKLVMQEYRDQLEGVGMRVTSRWIDSPDHEEGHVPGTLSNMHRGVQDIQDIDAADTLIAFTSIPSTTGGMHVEFGYALGKGKTVIVVGPYTNIFHRQAKLQFDNWNEFRREHLL